MEDYQKEFKMFADYVDKKLSAVSAMSELDNVYTLGDIQYVVPKSVELITTRVINSPSDYVSRKRETEIEVIVVVDNHGKIIEGDVLIAEIQNLSHSDLYYRDENRAIGKIAYTGETDLPVGVSRIWSLINYSPEGALLIGSGLMGFVGFYEEI